MSYKQKSGSPFARNFGIGASPIKLVDTRITYPDDRPDKVSTGTASVVEAQKIAQKNALMIDKQLGRAANKLGLNRGTDEFKQFASKFKPDTSNFKTVALDGPDAEEFYSGADGKVTSDASNIFKTGVPEGTGGDSQDAVTGQTLLEGSGGTVTTNLDTGGETVMTYVDSMGVPESTKKEVEAMRDNAAGNYNKGN